MAQGLNMGTEDSAPKHGMPHKIKEKNFLFIPSFSINSVNKVDSVRVYFLSEGGKVVREKE